jgi:hypothetical protein
MWHSVGIVVGFFKIVLFVLNRVDSVLDDFGTDDELAIDALLVLFTFCCVCVDCCVAVLELCLG